MAKPGKDSKDSKKPKPADKAKERGSSRIAKPAVKPAGGSSRIGKAAAKAAPAKPAKPSPALVEKNAKADKPKPATDRLAKPATDRVARPDAAAKAGTDKAERAAKESKGMNANTAAKGEKSDKPAAAKDAKGREKERAKPLPVVTYKCPFGASELNEWRALLLARRAELTNDIQGLYKDAIEAEDGHTTPNHIAERGSDADLQDMSLGMAGDGENELWQIERALHKIETGTPIPYGLCEHSKQPIARERLKHIPWTPLSIEAAKHMEDNRLTLEDLLVDG